MCVLLSDVCRLVLSVLDKGYLLQNFVIFYFSIFFLDSVILFVFECMLSYK